MFSKLSGKKMLVQYMYHKQIGANTKHTECDLLSMNEGSLRQARNKVLQVIVPGSSWYTKLHLHGQEYIVVSSSLCVDGLLS